MRRALASLFGGAVSKDTVSRAWCKVQSDWEAWQVRDLSEEDIIRLILDGTVVKVSLGIEDVLTAPRSPWQNPYVERLIGSIRRDCLDHVIVLNDRHLKRMLASYFRYYHSWRTHRSLEMDRPAPSTHRSPTSHFSRESRVSETTGVHR